jgi:hypothetical protein
MSAFGTKRTWSAALHMSAFGGKADMQSCLLLTEAGMVSQKTFDLPNPSTRRRVRIFCTQT